MAAPDRGTPSLAIVDLDLRCVLKRSLVWKVRFLRKPFVVLLPSTKPEIVFSMLYLT